MGFLLIAGISFSHPGGHREQTNLKFWKINNEQSIKASFLLVKNNEVYLENQDGEIIHIALDQLSKENRMFVNKKTKKIEALNLKFAEKNHAEKSHGLETSTIILMLIIGGLSLALLKARKKSLKLVFGSLSLLFVLYACSGDDEPTCTETIWYEDADGDGLGNPDVNQTSCEQPAGYVADNNDADDTNSNSGGSGTALAYDLSFLQTSFSKFSNVGYIDTDANYFYVESNGIPDHQMMVGITAWIERFPTTFKYTAAGVGAWAFPLEPEYQETNNRAIADELHKGAIAIATNGIPIFNPYNAGGELSYDIGELDAYGGHSGNGDDYHYHYPPTHLSTITGDYPIGFVFDGFPLYGITETDGSTVSDLDEHFGHEDTDGYYHYHTSETAPYMTPTLRGVVSVDQEGIAQNQIVPQPVGNTLRGLDDLVLLGGTANHEITDLVMNDTNNGYTLTYTTDNGTKTGTQVYSWDDAGLFTVTLTTPTEAKTITYSGDPGEIHSGAYGYNDGSSSSDFALTSEAIVNNELLDEYKCEMKTNDIENSIPLSWSNVPDGTGSLAITMHHYPNPDDANDPDKDPNQYLLLWGIDPSVTEITYGAADDEAWYMGSNKDGTAISYTSPCSPSAATHEYTITIYALSDTPASLPTVSSLSVDYGTLFDAIATVTTLGIAELTFDSVTE